MDTSETYIKMCEKAVEIQPHFEEDDSVGGTFIGGNLLCHHQSNWEREHSKIPSGVFYIIEESYTDTCPTCSNEEDKNKVIKTIWLPRQDDLQEMVRESGYAGFNGLKYFVKWLQNSDGEKYPYFRLQDNEEFEPFNSMEQLWLAFVMKKKYNKVWANNEWRNGSE